ncbi:hypothetical protein ZWY2020_051799 [Hordeum vulgare]|nr:hypothetical protein ZWY2020_051799 [Hordeum vulgare]
MRDCYGHTMIAFAEARALIRGLNLALANGYNQLVVKGDDLTLVRLIRRELAHARIPWEMHDRIIQLLCCFQDVEVRHVYREGNQVADTLCHEAYRCPGVWTLHQLLPPAVWAKVEDDCHGAVYQRVRRSRC